MKCIFFFKKKNGSRTLAHRLDTESNAASSDAPPCERCVGPHGVVCERASERGQQHHRHCLRMYIVSSPSSKEKHLDQHIPPSRDSLAVGRMFNGGPGSNQPPRLAADAKHVQQMTSSLEFGSRRNVEGQRGAKR